MFYYIHLMPKWNFTKLFRHFYGLIYLLYKQVWQIAPKLGAF